MDGADDVLRPLASAKRGHRAESQRRQGSGFGHGLDRAWVKVSADPLGRHALGKVPQEVSGVAVVPRG